MEILNLVREEVKKLGYIPLFDEYKNINSKVLVSTSEGYKIYVNFNSLLRSKKSRIFDTNNPYTIENIKLWLKLNCDHLELISTEYINNSSKLDFITKEGYKLNGTLHNLQLRKSLGVFDISNKYTINNIKLWLKINNKPYELLSTEFKGCDKKLKLYCYKHGEFEIRWRNLYSGDICNKCSIEGYKGENSPFWKGGISLLSDYIRTKTLKWKKDSFEKYNNTCNITGKMNDNLVIHHLYNFSNILIETIDLLNIPVYSELNKYTDIELKAIEELCLKKHFEYGLGVCLSDVIHKLYHNIYRNRNNSIEQFEEFKERYYKGLYDNKLDEEFKSYNSIKRLKELGVAI